MNVLYNVYDEQEKKNMGNYQAKEIQQMFGIKDASTYARNCSKVRNRYAIMRVEEKPISDILREWDEVTQRLRKESIK